MSTIEIIKKPVKPVGGSLQEAYADLKCDQLENVFIFPCSGRIEVVEFVLKGAEDLLGQNILNPDSVLYNSAHQKAMWEECGSVYITIQDKAYLYNVPDFVNPYQCYTSKITCHKSVNFGECEKIKIVQDKIGLGIVRLYFSLIIS